MKIFFPHRRHSVAANSIVAAVGRIINAAAGLVLVAVLARLLGDADLGIYLLVISYVALVQLTADFGLYLTFTKEIARSPAAAPQLLAHAATLRLLLVTAATTAGLAIAAFIPSLRNYPGIYLIIAVGGLAQSLSQLLMGVFQYHQSMWRAVVGDLAARGLHLAMIGCLAVTNTLTLPAAASALSASLVAAFGVHQLLSPQRIRRLRYNHRAFRGLARTSWPLGVLLLLGALYFKTDLVMISFFRPASDVGQYGVAFRLVESLLFFPAMLGGLLLPRIAGSMQQPGGRAAAARYVSEGAAAAALMGIVIVTLLASEAAAIIAAIAGAEFLAAAPLLRVMSIALAAMFIGNIFGYALVSLEQQRKLLLLYGALVLGNAIANALAIPRFGTIAAAWTTVGVEWTATLTSGYLVSRQLPLRVSRHTLLGGGLVVLAVIVTLAALPAALPVYVRLPAGVLTAAMVAGALRLHTAFPQLTVSPPQ